MARLINKSFLLLLKPCFRKRNSNNKRNNSHSSLLGIMGSQPIHNTEQEATAQVMVAMVAIHPQTMVIPNIPHHSSTHPHSLPQAIILNPHIIRISQWQTHKWTHRWTRIHISRTHITQIQCITVLQIWQTHIHKVCNRLHTSTTPITHTQTHMERNDSIF